MNRPPALLFGVPIADVTMDETTTRGIWVREGAISEIRRARMEGLQGRGLRIDLVLGSASVAERLEWSAIDRNARKGKSPSDHAPVIVDLTS